MNCKRGSNAVRCTLLGTEIHLRMNYRLRMITGQGDRRGRIKPEVSWVPDKHKGGVSVLVDLFRETFVFGINSSGHSNSTGQFIGLPVRRGNGSMFVVLEGCDRHKDSVFVFVIFF